MRKGFVLAAALVLLAVVAALLARSQRQAEPSSQPAWVTEAVTSMQKSFVGNPTPTSVRYRQGRKTASITIRFSHSAICGGCSAPAGVALARGRRATVTLDARTHRTLGFSVGD